MDLADIIRNNDKAHIEYMAQLFMRHVARIVKSESAKTACKMLIQNAVNVALQAVDEQNLFVQEAADVTDYINS